MNFKMWSKKKKAAVIVACILSVAVLTGLLYMFFKPEPPPKVSIAKAERGSVTQTLDLSGKVSPAKKGRFVPVNGTKVKTVNVRVGQKVNKGDVLATFDISSLNTLLAEKQKEYLQATKNYNNSKSTAVKASAELKEINKRLSEVNKELEKAQKEQAKKPDASKKPNSPAPTEPKPLDKFWELLGDALGMPDINGALEQLNGLINNPEGLNQLFGTGLSKLEMEKMQLEMKKVTLEAQSGAVAQGTLKTVMEAKKAELDNLTKSVNKLKNGWIAEFDGIVSEVNIKQGEICKSAGGAGNQLDLSAIIDLASGSADINELIGSLIGSTKTGITVEYYPFEISCVLNKYDILKVQLDQICNVTTADGQIVEGKITYISPVASQSSSMDISSIMGSGNASGVEAKVTIENPPQSLVIGLDADVSIDLGNKSDVLLVPTEAIKSSKDGSYVYIYNPKKRKITFSKVELGMSDNINYEVISGCEEGDIVVTAVPMGITLTDGQRVAIAPK